MNTPAQEHRAPQQHTHHGVEGNKTPHRATGLAAMKRDEARKQSTTTPQAKEQGNRAVARSNQIPRGGDQHSNWARTPQGNNRRGEGDNSQRGRGDTPQRNKNSKQEHNATPRTAHQGQREENRKPTGKTTIARNDTEEPQRERNQGSDQKPKRRARKARHTNNHT